METRSPDVMTLTDGRGLGKAPRLLPAEVVQGQGAATVYYEGRK